MCIIIRKDSLLKKGHGGRINVVLHQPPSLFFHALVHFLDHLPVSLEELHDFKRSFPSDSTKNCLVTCVLLPRLHGEVCDLEVLLVFIAAYVRVPLLSQELLLDSLE